MTSTTVTQLAYEGTIREDLLAWAHSLTTDQLEAKRQDIPFEVRPYGSLELAAIDEELMRR